VPPVSCRPSTSTRTDAPLAHSAGLVLQWCEVLGDLEELVCALAADLGKDEGEKHDEGGGDYDADDDDGAAVEGHEDRSEGHQAGPEPHDQHGTALGVADLQEAVVEVLRSRLCRFLLS